MCILYKTTVVGCEICRILTTCIAIKGGRLKTMVYLILYVVGSGRNLFAGHYAVYVNVCFICYVKPCVLYKQISLWFQSEHIIKGCIIDVYKLINAVACVWRLQQLVALDNQLCDTDRYSERQLMADGMFYYFLPNFMMTNSLKCQCVWFACFTLNIAVGEKRWTCFHLRELSCLQTPTPDLTSKKLF